MKPSDSDLGISCGKIRGNWMQLPVLAVFLVMCLTSGVKSEISAPSKSDLMKWRFRWDQNNEADLQSVTLKDLAIVTAFSANHEGEFFKFCEHLSAYKELHGVPYRFVVYSLGSPFTVSEINTYRQKCPPHTEFRDFPFARYPHYVRRLQDYRWKHLLIREILEESPLVLYGDSSLQITNQPTESLAAIVEKLKNKDSAKVFLFNECGHSIYQATHPNTYKFFNYSKETAKNTPMFDASPSMWLRTRKMRESLDNVVDCSLTKDCMAPRGASLYCNLKAYPASWMYAHCHRYDQSVINMVLSMNSGGRTEMYQYPGESVLRTVRSLFEEHA